MSFKRYSLDKDTSISTLGVSGNSGASNILVVGGEYSQDKNKKYLYRILTFIDTNSITSDIINNKTVDITTNASASAYLKLSNVLLDVPNAYEFTILTHPLTRLWSEGRGNREDTFTQVGYASWLNASSTAAWTLSGGDYVVDSNSSSQYFYTGYENLSANIKSILNNWLTGVSANNGLIIKMDDTAETITGSTSTNTQYFKKAFYSRNTNYITKSPYVEIIWDGEIRDYRNIFSFGNSGNLYFYNIVNGVLADIDSITTKFPGHVTISGATAGVTSTTFSSITSSISASRQEKGIYKVTFSLPLTSNVYNYFKDVWTITSSSSSISSSVEQVFTALSPINANSNFNITDVIVKLKDLKTQINKDETIYQRLFIKNNLPNILPVLTASITSVSSIIVEDGYYKILVDSTNEIYVDWQKLEFDKFNNFIKIDGSNFPRNIRFRIILKLNYLNQSFIIDKKENIFEII